MEASTGAVSGIRRRLFDVEEYHRMGEVGILNEDDHIELMEGRLFDSKTGYERPFDAREYHLMIETGIIREGARVELVEGEIVEMAAMGSRHYACVARLNALLTGRLGQAVIIAIQGPVRLMGRSEPEPDVAILEPREDFYARDLPAPENVLLLVEVSDTTLRYDREVKLPLYARAGVPETWIVDLSAETVEVHSRPATGEYRETVRAKRGEIIESKPLPSLRLTVDDVLG
jgi:Uma2 family endonuclease